MKYSRSDENAPSRTQRKKASTALQSLGVQLVELPRERFARLALPDALREAVNEARRITAHEGRRRQLQYIGRLMRDLDESLIQQLRADLDALNAPSRDEARRMRELEQWRARLIDDDDALTLWAREHPHADLQTVRALVRQARKEQTEQRPPRAFRELFQLLKTASISTDDQSKPDLP
ncbi:MAG TPA: ribosome biogenesis factor YjgA [Burkholderiaceae bacterium]|nr:ribosome biogenesis factor YjgA [Burkholderiaceae bacterium]